MIFHRPIFMLGIIHVSTQFLSLVTVLWKKINFVPLVIVDEIVDKFPILTTLFY